MTVSQLIKELELLPQHAVVVQLIDADLNMFFEIVHAERTVLKKMANSNTYTYNTEESASLLSKTCVLLESIPSS